MKAYKITRIVCNLFFIGINFYSIHLIAPMLVNHTTGASIAIGMVTLSIFIFVAQTAILVLQ